MLGGVKKAFRSEVAVAKSMSPISAAKLGDWTDSDGHELVLGTGP